MGRINFGLIWAAIVATAGVITYAFDNFVRADELAKTVEGITEKLEQQQLRAAYGQYYDRLDDYDEAIDEGNTDLAAEYLRQMEMLASEICELDPKWERCEPE